MEDIMTCVLSFYNDMGVHEVVEFDFPVTISGDELMFQQGILGEPYSTISSYNAVPQIVVRDLLDELQDKAQDVFFHIYENSQNFPYIEVGDSDFAIGLYSDHVLGFRAPHS